MHLRSLFRRRPTASMVISLIALFVALGGASYAAVSLPQQSVGTAQIKNGRSTFTKISPNLGAVRLANGAVINSKLANDSVSFKKIQPARSGACARTSPTGQVRVGGTCSATNSGDHAVTGAGR